MSDVTHVNDRQLARAIDGEMTPEEHAEFEAHLVRWKTCLEPWEALARFWNEIERTIETTPVKAPRGAREQLVEGSSAKRRMRLRVGSANTGLALDGGHRRNGGDLFFATARAKTGSSDRM